jgi:hypothetical protein
MEFFTEIQVNRVIDNWESEEPKERAREAIEKYGLPDEVTDNRLIWQNNDPWKRTMIVDEAWEHHYPVTHVDFFYQVVSYPVNIEKVTDVLKFDGSVIIDVVKGEVGSRCHMEMANFMTTNMAVEIMEGKRTWQEAQEFMAISMKNQENKEYLTSLQFEPVPVEEAVQKGEEFSM